MADRPDDREPALTINDGQTTLGYVFHDANTFIATDRDGAVLGEFPSPEAARSAILSHRITERRRAPEHG